MKFMILVRAVKPVRRYYSHDYSPGQKASFNTFALSLTRAFPFVNIPVSRRDQFMPRPDCLSEG